MNKNAKKWIKALRSGQYKQTQLELRNGDRFCCLGVACDLYRKEHSSVDWEGEDFLGTRTVLPESVREWLGFRKTDGAFLTRLPIMDIAGNEPSLVELNDAGWSFKKIADFITKKKPKGLFIKEK